ncbi:MAG: hypothetical protein RIQ89_743 [Bacteroidota bacterium]|jgi:predicted O-methyltransferase YrrM
MYLAYKYHHFLLHPIELYHFYKGKKDLLHNLIMIKAAKSLLKEKYNHPLALVAIEEIKRADFIAMNTIEGKQMHGNRPTYLFGKWLYFITRITQPEVVIETGVAHGVSSWTILNAMHKNQKGKLYSIDFPNFDDGMYNVDTFKKEPGWVVPDILKKRWQLQIGKSVDLLPALKKQLPKVDIFFHDSDHAYHNIHFECYEMFEAIRQGGIIICDDVHQNSAFQNFVNDKNIDAIQFFSKGATAIKK